MVHGVHLYLGRPNDESLDGGGGGGGSGIHYSLKI